MSSKRAIKNKSKKPKTEKDNIRISKNNKDIKDFRSDENKVNVLNAILDQASNLTSDQIKKIDGLIRNSEHLQKLQIQGDDDIDYIRLGNKLINIPTEKLMVDYLNMALRGQDEDIAKSAKNYYMIHLVMQLSAPSYNELIDFEAKASEMDPENKSEFFELHKKYNNLKSQMNTNTCKCFIGYIGTPKFDSNLKFLRYLYTHYGEEAKDFSDKEPVVNLADNKDLLKTIFNRGSFPNTDLDKVIELTPGFTGKRRNDRSENITVEFSKYIDPSKQ